MSDTEWKMLARAAARGYCAGQAEIVELRDELDMARNRLTHEAQKASNAEASVNILAAEVEQLKKEQGEIATTQRADAGLIENFKAAIRNREKNLKTVGERLDKERLAHIETKREQRRISAELSARTFEVVVVPIPDDGVKAWPYMLVGVKPFTEELYDHLALCEQQAIALPARTGLLSADALAVKTLFQLTGATPVTEGMKVRCHKLLRNFAPESAYRWPMWSEWQVNLI